MTYDTDTPARRMVDAGASESDRTYATLLHLSGGVLSLFTPAPAILGPLIMWLIRKNMSAFVDDHGRDALNFWITLIIYAVVIGLLGLPTLTLAWWIGFPLLFLFGVYGVISAAMAANRGEFYRYPMTLRLIPPAG